MDPGNLSCLIPAQDQDPAAELQPLPPHKEMGVTKAAWTALGSFRELVWGARRKCCASTVQDTLSHLVKEVGSRA